MAEYKLAGGGVITDEDIEREDEEYTAGSWEGHLERIHHGPAPVADEPLVTVTVKIPKSMVVAMDARSKNRSDFIRRAVAAAL